MVYKLFAIIIVTYVASRKKRSELKWGLAALFLGFWPLVILPFLKKLDPYGLNSNDLTWPKTPNNDNNF